MTLQNLLNNIVKITRKPYEVVYSDFAKAKNAVKQPAQNLRAWGQVARSPQLRQEYGQQVVKPAIQQRYQQVKPILQQQYSPKAQLNRIGSFKVLPSTPQFSEGEWTPLREFLKPKSYAGGPAGKSIAATIEGALPATIPTMGQGASEMGKIGLSKMGALKGGLTMAGFQAALSKLKGEKIEPTDLASSALMGAVFGGLQPKGSIMEAEKAKGKIKIKPSVPKELEPLAKEARKYGSAEEFMNAVKENARLKKNPDLLKASKSFIEDSRRYKDFRKLADNFQDFYTQTTKGVGGVGVTSQEILKGKAQIPQTQPQLSEQGLHKTQLPQSSLLTDQGNIPSKTIVTPKVKPLTESQVISDWEKAIKNEYQTITLKQLNQQKARAFVKEQTEMQKSLGGTKAYKGGKLPETAGGFPATALEGATKDKGAFSYQRETLLRNIEDTFGAKAKEVKQYFHDPILANETANTKFKNQLNTQIKSIFNKNGIKKGSAEDYAAADFIEGNLKLTDLKQQFPNKWQGIIKTANEGRVIYKDLLSKINAEITKYGYDPIPERQNYVTHTQEIQTFMDTIGNMLNLNKDKLPTAMANIHLKTKPGRQFFKFGLKRTGESTHEGLATALEKYIYPAGNQIFHTADIQRGRALEQYLQKANEGTQSRVLSNFQSWLSQYVDSLAGKQNIIDRPMEKVFGRRVLSVGDTLRKQTGANMVGGNVSSAMTNWIPFTQSVATTSKPAVIKGLFEGAMSPAKGLTTVDGVESGFLTRRFPEQGLQTLGQKVVGGANALFKWVDGFTAKSIVAGKYYEHVGKGVGKQEAMSLADEYAARVMADRSFGQIPLIFKSRTLGAFTQFQTEVNNQASFILKDIPKNLGYNKAQVASALGQFVLYSYLFNNLYEKITGRRPQIDVLHAGVSAYQKVKAGEELKNIINPTDINTPVGELVQNLPFTSIASGGRIPIGSAIPNPLALAAGTSTWQKELKKPLFYIIPPTGGGQIRKTIEGISAYGQGYSQTDKGQVRFPIEKTPQNLIRNAIFGQYATPEAGQYFNQNQRPLSENQSEIFKTAGEGNVDYYNQVMQDRETEALAKKIKEGKATGLDISTQASVYQNLALPPNIETLGKLYIDNTKAVKSLQEKIEMLPYEITTDALGNVHPLSEIEQKIQMSQYQNKLKYSQDLIDKIRKEKPEAVFDIEIQTYASGGGASVEDRANWVAETLSKATSVDEFNSLVGKMLEGEVLTDAVVEVLQNAGIPVNKYISGGKIKTKGTTAKKASAKKPPALPKMAKFSYKKTSVAKTKFNASRYQMKVSDLIPTRKRRPTITVAQLAKTKIKPMMGYSRT